MKAQLNHLSAINTQLRPLIAVYLVFVSFTFHFFNTAKAQNPKPIRYVVISDGDDTISVSRIVARGFMGKIAKLGHSFSFNDSFLGASELYQSLAQNRVTFEYVSGMPEILNDILPGSFTRFLANNEFPGEPSGVHVRSAVDGDTKTYKIATIKRIIERNTRNEPNTEFVYILVGDNGEKDIEVYKEISRFVAENMNPAQSKIGATFIHKLYTGAPALDLLPGQRPFFTFADFAIQVQALFPELITEGNVSKVVNLVTEALKSTELSLDSVRNLALPSWAELTDSDLENFHRIVQSSRLLTDDLKAELSNLVSMRAAHRSFQPRALRCAHVF